MAADKYEVLKQYFGNSSFRNGQEELADAILSKKLKNGSVLLNPIFFLLSFQLVFFKMNEKSTRHFFCF